MRSCNVRTQTRASFDLIGERRAADWTEPRQTDPAAGFLRDIGSYLRVKRKHHPFRESLPKGALVEVLQRIRP